MHGAGKVFHDSCDAEFSFFRTVPAIDLNNFAKNIRVRKIFLSITLCENDGMWLGQSRKRISCQKRNVEDSEERTVRLVKPPKKLPLAILHYHVVNTGKSCCFLNFRKVIFQPGRP